MSQDLHSAKSIPLCQRCKSEFVPTWTNNPRVPAVQLRSNDVPLQVDVHRHYHVAYLQDEERELQRYDDEITRLRLALEQLEAQRDVLKRNREERQSLLAPVRKIPRELLDEIFSHVCHLEHGGYALEISSGDFSKKGQVLAPAFFLSCVCHHWRSIVTSRRHLWSTISVDVSELNRDVRQLTDLYLRNSSDHPLKVAIHDSRGYDERDELGKYHLAIIKLLLSHHHRLEYLEVAYDNLITSVADRTLSFPSLSTLNVHLGGYTKAQSFWNAIRKAPRLTKVESEIVDPSILPCHQLTALEINTFCECRELFHILRFCFRLESLHFRELYPDVNWQPQHINLPFLQHLSTICNFEEPNDDCHSILFGHLTVPLLRSVEIQDSFEAGYSGRRETWVPKPFMGMLLRSGCKLRRLRLCLPYHHLPFPEFAEMLELCPELTDLNVEISGREGSHFTYDFLRALLPHPPDQSPRLLLPNLKSLDITECQMDAIDSQTATSLFDMIEMRATSLSAPRDIHLRFEDEPESVVEMEKALKDRAGVLQKLGTKCYIYK